MTLRSSRIGRSTGVAVLACAALVLSACGNDQTPTPAPGGDGANSGTEGSTPGAGGLMGEGAGDDCTISDPVPIGAALSLTGGAASYGESQQNGLKLAAKELNAKGGVTYDLTIEDDATDPRQGISVFEKFVNDDKSLIIGPTLSNGAIQSDPVAQDAGVPVLGISNTAAGVTEIGDYIFRDSLTEAAVIPQTIEKAKATYDLKTVVLMYSNDDAFTKSGADAFKAALKDNDVTIAEEITFSKADTDFRALITQAQGSNPDGIVVSGLIEAAIPLVSQARESGFTGPIIGGNGFNNPSLMKEAGDAANGVVVGAAWNSASDNPLNQDFLTAYQDAYDAAPDQFGAQAYTGLSLVDHAVRAGCSGERDAIREQFTKIKDIPTVLGDFSFDDNRDAVHPAVVQVVKDGQFTVLP